MNPSWDIRRGDAIEVLRGMEPESVHCVVTSPPYWGLRSYGVDGAYGLEPTLEEYIERMVEVFREVRRVLRKDGTVWLNLGALRHGRSFVGIELNPEYVEMARERIIADAPLLNTLMEERQTT